MTLFALVEPESPRRVAQLEAEQFPVAPPLEWVDATDVADTIETGWSYDGSAFHPPPGLPPRSVEDALRALDVAAEASRAGGVSFQAAAEGTPSVYPTDPGAIAQLQGALAAVQAGLWLDGTAAETTDRRFVPFVAADVQGLFAAVVTHFAAAQARKAVLTAAVRVDPATDVTTGWPA